MKTSLKDKTLDLVLDSGMTLKQLSDRSGLPLSWIHTFRAEYGKGRFNVDYVQTLYEALSGKELSL